MHRPLSTGDRFAGAGKAMLAVVLIGLLERLESGNNWCDLSGTHVEPPFFSYRLVAVLVVPLPNSLEFEVIKKSNPAFA